MEGGSDMMTVLETKTLRFSKRALQVSGLVLRESEWAGSPYSVQIPRITTDHCPLELHAS